MWPDRAIIPSLQLRTSLPLSGRILSLDKLVFYNYIFELRYRSQSVALMVCRYRTETGNSENGVLFGSPIIIMPLGQVKIRIESRGPFYLLTIIKSHIEHSYPARIYLLLGDTAHSNLRLLVVYNDRPPELKFLNLSWHDMIMDIDGYYAHLDANRNTKAESPFYQVTPRQYDRKTEKLPIPLRTKDSHPQTDTADTAESTSSS